MDLRSVSSPACTLSLHKSFLLSAEIARCLHSERPCSFSRKLSMKCCCHHARGALKTEEIDDSTLIDIQESSNGYVLFKFGTNQWYADPHRPISSIGQVRSITYAEVDGEVIDCTPVVCRLPNEKCFSMQEPQSYQAASICVAPSSTLLHGKRAEMPACTYNSEKSLGLPLDLIGHRNFADHLANEVRNDSFARFLHSWSAVSGMVKLLPANINLEDASAQSITLGPGAVQSSSNSSTIRRADRVVKKPKARHKKPARDLYRASSFQMYELIFCYPFMDSSKASSAWKAIPREKYAELFGIVNQIAVGLAGSGLALVLFVASRMLCLNATLDSIKMMSLLRGVGLLWLSSALQRFGSVFRLMAECRERATSERKKYLAMLKKELHSVTFTMCTMVMLSMLRLG